MTETPVYDIAKLCHEVNRAYCRAIGDYSQLPWDEAPDWQKQSAINGVHSALENPTATPESQHESWLAEKVKDGWVWGPMKDQKKKEHPCMVAYDKLPLEQRIKDFLFLAVVRSVP